MEVIELSTHSGA